MATDKSYTFEEIKQKMINYCVYQDRCHYEVDQKMKEFLLIPEAKDEIILYLIKENYLNEERFVRSYIRGKFSIKQWGRLKIKNHLKQKQISEKLINKCMDEIEEDDYEKTLYRLIDKNFISDNFQEQTKLIKKLLAKGYEYELIRNCLNER